VRLHPPSDCPHLIFIFILPSSIVFLIPSELPSRILNLYWTKWSLAFVCFSFFLRLAWLSFFTSNSIELPSGLAIVWADVDIMFNNVTRSCWIRSKSTCRQASRAVYRKLRCHVTRPNDDVMLWRHTTWRHEVCFQLTSRARRTKSVIVINFGLFGPTRRTIGHH